jgi:hypothetical protein
MQKEDVAPSNPLWRWKVLQVVAVMREFEIAFVIASTMGPIAQARVRQSRARDHLHIRRTDNRRSGR